MKLMYRWMHVLKGLLFAGKCMVRSWRTCSTRASITACTGQIFQYMYVFANGWTRFAWQRLFFTNCYSLLRSKCHLQGSLQGDPCASLAPHERLFLTLSFLAHCPTLLYIGTKFGVPNNTLSVHILHPTLAVLKTELVKGLLQETN